MPVCGVVGIVAPDERLIFGNTGIDTNAALHAVFRINNERRLLAVKRLQFGIRILKAGGRLFGLLLSERLDANTGVGTDDGTLSALDAFFGNPFGHTLGNTAFFVLGSRRGKGAVRRKLGNRQFVPFLNRHRAQNLLNPAVFCRGKGLFHVNSAVRAGGVLHLFHCGQGEVDRGIVFLHNVRALFAVGFFDKFLHVLNRFGFVQHAGNLKVSSLHNGIDSIAHTGFTGDFRRVNHIEFELLVDNPFLRFNRNLLPDFGCVKGAVQQENAAVFGIGQHIQRFHVAKLMTGKKIRLGDKVGTANRALAEPEVRDGKTAGLFGVVGEIRLRRKVWFSITYNFDRILVCADRTVRAEPVEHRFVHARFRKVEVFVVIEAFAEHIIFDTDDKAADFFAG